MAGERPSPRPHEKHWPLLIFTITDAEVHEAKISIFHETAKPFPPFIQPDLTLFAI